MSFQLEVSQAQAVVARARLLFGDPPTVTAGSAPLQSAAESTANASQQTSGMSGRSIARYSALAGNQSRGLSAASDTDTSLESHLRNAAAITQDGARRLDAVVAQTTSIAHAAPMARTPAAQLMVLNALRAQLTEAQSVTTATAQQVRESAGRIEALNYGNVPEAPPNQPSDTAGEDPPHGNDPRYWLDVTKIVQVPDGELAPTNTVQIGPNSWYPAPDNSGSVVPPPPPAKYPVDLGDIRVIDPGSGDLFPPGYREMAPGIGVPYPDRYVPAPWPSPQQPIDIRDVIEVAPDQLAPSGYIEYLPGWWMPDRS